MRMKQWKFLGVLLISLVPFADPWAAEEPARICEEFRRLLSAPPFMLGHSLEDVVDDRGTRRIPNLDVDGDGLIDVVYWSCPGQGSPVPADPCTTSIEFFSGKKIKFEEYGFRLILFRSKVYAIAASAGHNRVTGDGKIWRIDGSGVKLICSKL